MRGLPRSVKRLLSKSRDSATQAIATYNDPRSSFRTGNFAVLMSIAWTSLLHGHFERQGVNYFYKSDNGRYVKVDGDKKAWELNRCVSEVFTENDPIRKNLELFIKLRNRIEHRELPALDPELVGECQALIINYETWLTRTFGASYALIETLFIPMQLFTGQRPLPRTKLEHEAINFIRTFRNVLEPQVIKSQEYSFKAYLVPKIGNHRSGSDIAIEFVRFDPANPEEMNMYEQAIVAIKEKHVLVANLNHFRPSDVIKHLRDLGHKVNVNWHTKMWKKYKVRPDSGSSNKTDCKNEYCVFDSAHNDYLYTDSWLNFLHTNELTKKRRAKIGAQQDAVVET